jgi:signal transduction histidine kinase
MDRLYGLDVESGPAMTAAALGLDRPAKGLEPGIHWVLRVLLTTQIVMAPLVRRIISHGVGLDIPLVPHYLLTLPLPVLLAGLVWLPSWDGRRGLVLLPVILVLESAAVVGDKFLTLLWLVPGDQQEMVSLALLIRAWLFFHCVTLLAAWQYGWRPSLAWAFALVAVDFVLGRPFVQAGSAYDRLFVVLTVARAATVPAVAAGIGWLLENQREQRAALATANQKLIDYAATTEQLAVSRERNRLARELHDTLAHSLSAVTVQLEAIHALWDVNAESARSMLSSARQNARGGLTEARRALHALRASPLEDLGLSAAIGDLARSTAARSNLQLVLTAPSNGLGLRADQEQFLYRVAQEAMSNVVRHAHASELRVTLERVNGHLTMTVADDGVGFDRDRVDTSTHLGLKGIQERVEMIGGHLTVESARGTGTTLRVAVFAGGES